MPPSTSPSIPERIVVRQVNWLGDAVMTLPALERLRAAKPTAHIAICSDQKLAALWKHVPAIDDVITFDRGNSAWARARHIRAKRFDSALIFPNSFTSALEMFLARVPRRVGYSGDWRGILLTNPVSRPGNFVRMRKKTASEIRKLIEGSAPIIPSATQDGHHTAHYLYLAQTLGASAEPLPPRLQVNDGDCASFAAKFLQPVHWSSGAVLCGMNPGAEYGSAKRWPIERYAEAALRLHQRCGCRWLIFGGPGDVAAAGELEGKLHAMLAPGRKSVEPVILNLAGRTTLDELAAGLKSCALVLSNDSGPMHVAAAVGTTVIVPFGSTSPALTAPGLPGEDRHVALRVPVPCAPCFRRDCPIDLRCLTGITVEAVVSAALKVLDARGGPLN